MFTSLTRRVLALAALSVAATRVAGRAGGVLSVVTAVTVVAAVALSEPLLGFSETWQLVVNDSTTIVTVLMVFLIETTQHRDGAVGERVAGGRRELKHHRPDDPAVVRVAPEQPVGLERRRDPVPEPPTDGADQWLLHLPEEGGLESQQGAEAGSSERRGLGVLGKKPTPELSPVRDLL